MHWDEANCFGGLTDKAQDIREAEYTQSIAAFVTALQTALVILAHMETWIAVGSCDVFVLLFTACDMLRGLDRYVPWNTVSDIPCGTELKGNGCGCDNYVQKYF